ncbi:MAG: hypothetical protein LBR40_00225 [Bacilli bacterium]|jgi:ABC-2 type transport system permease protein|nr:hypothetical protein [Bacilli bacterium]
MLSNFFDIQLFKIFLKESKPIKWIKSSKIRRTLLTLLVIVLIVAAIYSIFAPIIVYKDDIKNTFSFFDLGNIFLTLGFYVSYILCVITVIGYTYVYCYLDKNINNYMPLPIKPRIFSTTKLIFNYYNAICIAALVMLPFLLMYFTLTNSFSLISLLIVILYLIIMPATIVALVSIIESTIMFFVNKIKNKALAKGIVVSIFVVIVAILYLYFVFVISFNGGDSKNILNAIAQIRGIFDKISPLLFYANWGSALLNSHSIINMLYMIGSMIIAIAISIFYFGKIYFPGVIGFNEGGSIFKRKDKVKLNTKKVSITKWFFINEFKSIYRTPAYLINVLSGNALIVIIYLAMLGYQYYFGPLGKELANVNVDQYLTIPIIILIVIGVGTFFTLFNAGAASTISREAHNIKCYFIMPIDFKKAFIGKIIFYFIIEFLTLFIFLMIPMIILKLALIKMIIAIFVMIILCLATILIPISINLLFYDFDWENETAVVKRSKSVVISLIASFIIMAIIYGIGALLFLLFNLKVDIVAYILLGFYILLIFVTVILYQKLINRFMKSVRDM